MRSVLMRFLWVLCLCSLGGLAQAEGKTYSFGVINVYTVLLSAQYWNPILEYVGRKSGVNLQLKLARSSEETSNAEIRGEYDFVWDNHFLAPSHASAGYRPILRRVGKPIRGQLVVPDASPLKTIEDLRGKEIGAPSKTAFAAYAVTMSALIKAGVPVKPVFSGNQDGVLWQLRAGRIAAASVNSKVALEYEARENFKLRALWTSEDFLDFPVGVHPRVPAEDVQAVRDAFANMANDPEGLKILKASAQAVNLDPPYGFAVASEADYGSQREVYKRIADLEGR